MKQARVYLEWLPSVSLDVVSVEVSVVADGEQVFSTVVTPDVTKVDVGSYAEGVVLVATVSVSDGTYSVPASTSFQVPDLTRPEPVSGLDWSYEVEDV